MYLHPLFLDRNQPFAVQPSIGHAGLCRQGSGQMPWSLAAERSEDGLSSGCSQLEKIADLGTGIAPLFPVTHPYSAPEPFVYFRDRPVILRDPVTVHPAPHIFRQFLIPIIHRDEPTPSRQQTNLPLELPERCRFTCRTPSMPGAPLFARTRFHASPIFSGERICSSS